MVVLVQVNCLKLQEKYGKKVLKGLRGSGALSMKRINKTAKKALEDGYWPHELKVQIGSTLLRELMEVAVTGEDKRKVFLHEKQV